MNKDREERVFQIEFRELKDEDKKIVGHAAVFNELSEDLGGFRERINPGAFKKTIKEADIRALFNHDPNFVLGRNKAGTLKLEEDEKGLRIEIEPSESQLVRDMVLIPIERGDVDQMSFGFKTIKDTWIQEDGEETIRELNEVKLFDISPVTFPAYPQTDVAMRKLGEFQKEIRQEKVNTLEIKKKKLELLDLDK